jgi:hypothetical protein
MRSLLASLLVLGSIPLSASALPVSVADGTFADTDWSAAEILDTSGAATFAASQQIAGGNPGEFRQTQHSVPGAGQSIIVDQVFSGGHYDPAASGAIDHIDFALDVRFTGGSVGTSQVGYQLILVQGGVHYNALSTGAVALGPGGGAPGAWLSFSFPNLTRDSFTRVFGSGPDRPDFSATGGDIRFGYMTQNTSIDTAISTTSGIDNWSVLVYAPEPPASALLGAALVGLAVAAVGRRPCAPRASVEDSRDAGSLPSL